MKNHTSRAAFVIALTAIVSTGVDARTYSASYHGGTTTGVDNPVFDASNESSPVYYDLRGVRVDEPVNGEIYIEVRGDRTRKIKLILS